MADHDYKTGGWREKYRLTKADGSAVDPDAVYFVLRLDEDPHAQVAALAYADSVEADNPQFAADIRVTVGKHQPRTRESPQHEGGPVSYERQGANFPVEERPDYPRGKPT